MKKTTYAAKKARAQAVSRALSASGRDIGAIPPVANIERKREALASFTAFCRHYLGKRFTLQWSPDHLRVIGKIEQAVTAGGQFAVAMPRGSGKTTLCEAAALWALLSGRHQFLVVIAASAMKARQTLDSLKSELQHNELLAADFPEVCYPIRCLQNETRRVMGQTLNGQPTLITWGKDSVALPWIPGSRCAGAAVRVSGLSGSIRGTSHTRPDGSSIRPTLAVIDDPQTDSSARSPTQCHARLKLITGAVLGLAGPGKRVAAIMPCTVIAPGDLADVILDAKTHPVWNGERCKMLYSPPSDAALWAKYAEIRADSLRQHGDIREATALYAAHREAMDAGAVVGWAERHDPDHLSALQTAMELKLRDPAAFEAEYQNEPQPAGDVASDEMATIEQVLAKATSRPRGAVPAAATRLTAMVDVQKSCLWWMVCAWMDGFAGAVVEYGAWPDQRRTYFTLDQIHPTIADAAPPGAAAEGALYHALTTLTDQLLGRTWQADGPTPATLPITRLMIDTAWGDMAGVVRQFAAETAHRAVILPSFGMGIGADKKPISTYRTEPGDRIGAEWYMPKAKAHMLYDTNHWKTFCHRRIRAAPGDIGSLSLPAGDHRMLAEHITAERPVAVTGQRTVNLWHAIPGRDNHLLDCLVGCAVGASEQGISAVGHRTTDSAPQRKRYT
jgi:hypothetical protein